MSSDSNSELTDEQLGVIAGEATSNFKGNAHQLEAAIGAMFVGKHYGWKVAYLVHDRRTIKKFEDILGINFREQLPEKGPKAEKSLAFIAVQKVSNFWKAVKGEIEGVKTPEIR